MKALVFSDTHGKINKVIDVINSHKNVDLIIHLGDFESDAQDLEAIFKGIKFEYVSGNNDYFPDQPSEKIIYFGDKKLFITHGHQYKIYEGIDRILKRGKEINADVVLFGHTHVGYKDVIDGILLFNPGSIFRPRKGNNSYGMLEIIDNKFYSMICELR